MLNFQRRRSEGSRKTIIITIICQEIVETCVAYESVLKITKMENKIILIKALFRGGSKTQVSSLEPAKV